MWSLRIFEARIDLSDKTDSSYVWPVRGTTALPAQIPQTGLMWSKNGIIGFEATEGGGSIAQPDYTNTTANLDTLSWSNALTAIVYLNSATIKLCGHSDWRLPNRNELRSLMNQGQSNNMAT